MYIHCLHTNSLILQLVIEEWMHLFTLWQVFCLLHKLSSLILHMYCKDIKTHMSCGTIQVYVCNFILAHELLMEFPCYQVLGF